MISYVALLRAINLGKHNKLSMKGLAALFESAGATHVQTYLRSGNVCFVAAEAEVQTLLQQVATAIYAQAHCSPTLLLRSHESLAAAVEANPFP